jgi:NADP-dependent 3-hydroxy acid dehydrogenase YdfG
MDPTRGTALVTGASSGIGGGDSPSAGKGRLSRDRFGRRKERLVELAESTPNITLKPVDLCSFPG